jgi:sulfite exporter TauE/SafE
VAVFFALAEAPIFPAWKNLRGRWIAAASAQPGLLGLASGLLPCGLLHAWILVAAATLDPLHGATLLFVLWLGTIPALEFGSFAFQRPMQGLRRRFPRSFPLFFLALALLPIFMRQGFFTPDAKVPTGQPASHCHETP